MSDRFAVFRQFQILHLRDDDDDDGGGSNGGMRSGEFIEKKGVMRIVREWCGTWFWRDAEIATRS